MLEHQDNFLTVDALCELMYGSIVQCVTVRYRFR